MSTAIRHNGSICVRCAFRARLLSLQNLRLRSDVSKSRYRLRANDNGHPDEDHSFPKGSKITYYKAALHIPGLNKAVEDIPVKGSNGVIKKYYNSRLAEFGREKGTTSGKVDRRSFDEALRSRLQIVRDEMKNSPVLERMLRESRKREMGIDSISDEQRFKILWKSFVNKVFDGEDNFTPTLFARRQSGALRRDQTIMDDLKSVFRERGAGGLDDRIKYAFYGHVTGSRFTASDIQNQKALADLRYPTEWFPATRTLQRKVHLHVGPTNSGKTYHALQRLEKAETGVYAGPLRLLAHEVYTRMNARGRPCSLITGEERRVAKGAVDGTLSEMSSCTVEMMPLNKTLDVAVIDEIQMIGNAERGWAWTQALLGVKAKELHLCGEERTVPLIKEICASIGEEVEIHRYQRLSPLEVASSSLNGKLGLLRKGDCIVSFSVIGIHALRRQIESATGRKVATVYGSLPPETRAQQARLFNDPDNDYDFLVASDAVGMGLNLAIKRIIFEAASKFDGYQRRTLGVADIKQIAGRAGRFRIATQANEDPVSVQDLVAAKDDSASTQSPARDESVGLVTTLEQFDFPIVKSAMSAEPEPIVSAGLFPPGAVLQRFASYFPPGTPFSYILWRLHEVSQVHSRFHLCGLKDHVLIADLIEPVQGLTVEDRNIICSCPAGKSDIELWKDLMPALARCIAGQTGGSIIDLKELPLEILEAEVSPSRGYLRALEQLHKGIVAYLWLSYRFAGIFNTRPLAFHVKQMVEDRIEDVLGKFSFSVTARKRIAQQREQQVLEGLLDKDDEKPEELEKTAVVPRSVDLNESGKDIDSEEDVRETNEDALEDSAKPERENDITGDSPYDDRDIASRLEGRIPPDSQRLRLEEQTTLTSGGDRFGGEEEIEIEEPIEFEDESATVLVVEDLSPHHSTIENPVQKERENSDEGAKKVIDSKW